MPEFCPLLSTPARQDAAGGLIPGVEEHCREEACMLWKSDQGVCALEQIGRQPDRFDDLAMTVRRGLVDLQAHVRNLNDQLATKFRDVNGKLGELESAVSSLVPELASLAESGRRLSAAAETWDRRIRELEAKLEEPKRFAQARDLHDRGLTQLHAGRLSEAAEILRECLEFGDHAPHDTAGLLGATLVLAGDAAAGYEYLERATQDEGRLAAPLASLAHTLAMMGKWDLAEKAAREALERDPRCAAARNTYGNLQFLSGRTTEALESWRRAVDDDPGLDAAWENLKRQRLVGNSELEERLLRD